MSGSSPKEGLDMELECSKKNATKRQKKPNKRERLTRRSNQEEKESDKNKCETIDRIRPENDFFENSGKRNMSVVGRGGDGGDEIRQRLRCRQHELNSFLVGIDTLCVTTSRDLTSKTAGQRGKSDDDRCDKEKVNCPRNESLRSCSASTSTCCEGSYSRRKHHKHHKHKHKHKNKSPTQLDESAAIHPKVNPVFVWVRQEDSRIMEVFCEDYDYKNRLKLRRTNLGWRAIPKTKCYADMALPKVMQNNATESLIKPKKIRRRNRWKAVKKAKKSKRVQKVVSDYCVNKEDSGKEDLMDEAPVISVDNSNYSLESHDLKEDSTRLPSCSPPITDIPVKHSRTLIKSNSCDFTSLRIRDDLVRSTSLDFNMKNSFNFNRDDDTAVKNSCSFVSEKQVPSGMKCDEIPMTEKEVKSEETIEKNSFIEMEVEKDDQEDRKNYSQPILMDMTKHDSDFNDADCDELVQLLKVIPDLEFVHEDDLEEVDEEEWQTPTDLTLPKTPAEEKPFRDNGAVSLNISPLITVTSASLPQEPLTAPLPEVTITPVPKPAHQQQKRENNLLESILSSIESVKPEMDERSCEKKFMSSLNSKKPLKHLSDSNVNKETKQKKLKIEDLSLKNFMPKACSGGKQVKGMDLEKCIQNIKTLNGENCSKPRFQELLTDKGHSDPIAQLKEVLSDPHLAVPDPLLVPRARLPALVASPASEIPRLLTMHLEKTVEEKPCPPVKDADILEVPLSNLQSLLASGSEEFPWKNNRSLADCQPFLEALLGWQKYRNNLLETELKSSKTLPPGNSGDITKSPPLSQMFWLPYLNQLDFSTNHNILTLMNSLIKRDYQEGSPQFLTPPQINICPSPQPSPFLTPTSPLAPIDVEMHLNTLGMWQKTLCSQQSVTTRSCSNSAFAPTLDTQKNEKSHMFSPQKFCCDSFHSKAATSLLALSKNETTCSMQEVYHDDHQNRYLQINNQERHRIDDQSRRTGFSQQCRRDWQNQFKKSFKANGNLQNCLSGQSVSKEDMKLSGGNISMKPLPNLLDKTCLFSKRKCPRSEEESKKDLKFTDNIALRLQQLNTEIHKLPGSPFASESNMAEQRCDKSDGSETPKLKVKNLVDPNMSPPKLLKQIGPEHLATISNDDAEPVQEDGHSHLWHPLFGSNQIRLQPYSSPWRWTTVTVNGE